ncbi:putative interferon-induced protein 44 [Triplophysa rosa]|uniref:Interferon-induced protein 44 n=1 Tax=Triplophysa rosa TaxID=992332 RepID=A0A9W7WIB4_TRIRA|nr:putative interferon-induced protein 44 [Triplophysa rosa]
MGSSGSTPEVRAEPSTTDLAELLQAIERLSVFHLGFQHQWRNIDWGQKAALKQRLESFSLSRTHVQFIKILLVGEVGVGKSSFINSVSSALQGRITSGALADSSAAHSSTSFTQRLRTHRVRTANGLLPFALCDTMGLESLAGSLPEDIINAIFGHVKEGYRFDHKNAVAQDSEHYARNPDLCDKAFCVVYIIAADKVNVIDERLVEKFRKIRKIISEKGKSVLDWVV